MSLYHLCVENNGVIKETALHTDEDKADLNHIITKVENSNVPKHQWYLTKNGSLVYVNDLVYYKNNIEKLIQPAKPLSVQTEIKNHFNFLEKVYGFFCLLKYRHSNN
jgi:uncharacterized protein with ACT and thioredoxin-like domain